MEPLDANDWLCTIANNLEVAAVGENDKVLFATHFLAGPARTWWETTRETVADGHAFTWEDFSARFRKYHIPQGVMGLMRDKFLGARRPSARAAISPPPPRGHLRSTTARPSPLPPQIEHG